MICECPIVLVPLVKKSVLDPWNHIDTFLKSQLMRTWAYFWTVLIHSPANLATGSGHHHLDYGSFRRRLEMKSGNHPALFLSFELL